MVFLRFYFLVCFIVFLRRFFSFPRGFLTFFGLGFLVFSSSFFVFCGKGPDLRTIFVDLYNLTWHFCSWPFWGYVRCRCVFSLLFCGLPIM